MFAASLIRSTVSLSIIDKAKLIKNVETAKRGTKQKEILSHQGLVVTFFRLSFFFTKAFSGRALPKNKMQVASNTRVLRLLSKGLSIRDLS